MNNFWKTVKKNKIKNDMNCQKKKNSQLSKKFNCMQENML